MARIYFVVVLFVLGGCSTINRYHVPPKGIIDDADAPNTIIYRDRAASATTAETSASAFLEAYKRSYAASLPGSEVPEDADVRALEMTHLGMTVIEIRCDLFFQSIGRGSQKIQFARREVEIITAALTTVLGLTGASDDLVAVTGLTSGGILASMANYENVFFFSPEIGKVQRLVNDSFSQMRTALLQADRSPRSFDGAIRALKSYQSICTAHQIRRLVNEAVDAGQVKVVYPGDRSDTADGAVEILVDRLATALELEGISARDVPLVKWAIIDGASAEELDFICPALSPDIRGKVCEGDLGARKLTPLAVTSKPMVSNAISAISLLREDWVEGQLRVWKVAQEGSKDAVNRAKNDAKSAKNDAETALALRDAALAVANAVASVEAKSSVIPNQAALPSPEVTIEKP